MYCDTKLAYFESRWKTNNQIGRISSHFWELRNGDKPGGCRFPIAISLAGRYPICAGTSSWTILVLIPRKNWCTFSSRGRRQLIRPSSSYWLENHTLDWMCRGFPMLFMHLGCVFIVIVFLYHSLFICRIFCTTWKFIIKCIALCIFFGSYHFTNWCVRPMIEAI